MVRRSLRWCATTRTGARGARSLRSASGGPGAVVGSGALSSCTRAASPIAAASAASRSASTARIPPERRSSTRAWACRRNWSKPSSRRASHERRLDGAHQRAEASALPAPGAGMSLLRAKCPTCKANTAVALGPEYECHSCGRTFAAGLVRVPRAWGDGGEPMIESALLPLEYPETSVVEADSLVAKTLAVASDLPVRPIVLGRCCWSPVRAVVWLEA